MKTPTVRYGGGLVRYFEGPPPGGPRGPSKVWFTSDQHFGHANIIRHCNRPFAHALAMDKAILQAWQARVGADDDVYVLGDFFWGSNAARAVHFLQQLPGSKYLLRGNHDRGMLKDAAFRDQFEWIEDVAVIAVEGQQIVLGHYPMQEWEGSYEGSWHLHGHSHGKVPAGAGMLRRDVGVDVCEGFAPISFEELREIFSPVSPT